MVVCAGLGRAAAAACRCRWSAHLYHARACDATISFSDPSVGTVPRPRALPRPRLNESMTCMTWAVFFFPFQQQAQKNKTRASFLGRGSKKPGQLGKFKSTPLKIEKQTPWSPLGVTYSVRHPSLIGQQSKNLWPKPSTPFQNRKSLPI